MAERKKLGQSETSATQIAVAERNRLNKVRTEFGDQEYAEEVGRSVVTHQVIMMNPELVAAGAAVIKTLQIDLDTITSNSSLALSFAQGVKKELEERRFFK